jgi:asparagine synthase (glutamine-hydrolysing)
MCGIAGLLRGGHGGGDLEAIVRAMGSTLLHRGPDAGDVWVDKQCGIGLAHRRLAIVDLTPAGAQPMFSPSMRYVTVFNGEIYNHGELRAELERAGLAPRWRGHSDTESLLAAVDAWGLELALTKAVGMFALALWDRENRCLHLARDRMGEKPLYYGWLGDDLVFASELKALKSHPEFRGEIDRGSLALLMRHNYIAAPHSIYRGIRKLPAGTHICVDADIRGQRPEPVPYWTLASCVQLGQAAPWTGTDEHAINELDGLLRQAIAQQMVADVPLGAFLSGGIDSSMIVALMQAQSSRPVNTFTIGFHESRYNEADQAAAVARHLGTSHTELYVSPQDAIDLVPSLPRIYDEPFADSSQLPTYLVSRMTRQHVTVALSGDGGDELFCGYERYFVAQALWNRLQRIPKPFRHLGAHLASAMSVSSLDGLLRCVDVLLPGRLRHLRNPGSKAKKLAHLLNADNPEVVYRQLISHWDDPGRIVLGLSGEPSTLLCDPAATQARGFMERMMVMDSLMYLPDDILVKVDRAAMANSLETRVPFLDHRVVAFAWTLPQTLKSRDGKGKWILRQVLGRYVPESLTDRPKMGFGVPIDAWLRGSLRPWAEELLDPVRLRDEGFFQPAEVRAKWQEHISGIRDWHYRLWNVLMFQAWLQHERATSSIP